MRKMPRIYKCMVCGKTYEEGKLPVIARVIQVSYDKDNNKTVTPLETKVDGCCGAGSLIEINTDQEIELFRVILETARECENTINLEHIYSMDHEYLSDRDYALKQALLLKARASGRPLSTAERIMMISTAGGDIRDPETKKEFIDLWKEKRPFGYVLPTQPDHIDYIYGIDPISNTPSGVGAVILKQERKARLKKNDTLVGPNGHKWKVSNVSQWDFIHRLLSIGKKYYNSRIYLTAEK